MVKGEEMTWKRLSKELSRSFNSGLQLEEASKISFIDWRAGENFTQRSDGINDGMFP